MTNSRPRGHQVIETVNGISGAPGDAAQQQDAEEWIVEGPREVTQNRHEDSSASRLEGPEEWLLNVVFLTATDHFDSRRISGEFPIAFVVKLDMTQVAADFLSVGSAQFQINESVPKSRSTGKRQPDPLCKIGASFAPSTA